ncbi:MAG: undecaprenyl/decaprenyl-phosphate alpha-N-acetylglucosaminyl 1-phosphate transferase [Deltaproteobacteria bacterium]|nr:undecaprenyl/decaprenyl-phosphate alpha-N-acetylglucosaminyl 1-phosphate transferase [Deltaproteobacteria bacterium]
MSYLVAFVLAAAVSAFLTPLVCRLAHAIDAVDAPGEARKIHDRPIPRIGGVAVVAGFFVPILGLLIHTNRISRLMFADGQLVTAFVVGALVILALGVYDDLRSAGAKLKLAVETVVALGMWFAGFRIELLSNPVGMPIALDQAASLFLTVFWIVGITNALNLIDGLDGLAAGVSLCAVGVLFGVSLFDNNALLCLLAAALAGSVLGFLFFNFNPARIFLGDSGALFLGFTLATISVWTQQKGATLAALVIPVLALGLPILDTTLSVVRRVRRGKNPFQADREHLHHRLLAIGLSHKNAVLTLYTASATFALGALALLDNNATRRAIALSAVGLVVYILVRRASSPLPQVGPREAPSGELRDLVRVAAREIRRGIDADQVWLQLVELAPRLGLDEIRLATSADGSGDQENVRHWRREGSTTEERWKLESTLGPYDDSRRLALEERQAHFGDLRVLFIRSANPSGNWKGRSEVEQLLEMLRDALIDYFVSRDQTAAATEQALVVSLEDKRPRAGAR